MSEPERQTGEWCKCCYWTFLFVHLPNVVTSKSFLSFHYYLSRISDQVLLVMTAQAQVLTPITPKIQPQFMESG